MPTLPTYHTPHPDGRCSGEKDANEIKKSRRLIRINSVIHDVSEVTEKIGDFLCHFTHIMYNGIYPSPEAFGMAHRPG